MRRAWIVSGLALLLVACSDKKPVATGTANTTPAGASTSMAMNLVGTEWRLEDLGGAGVIDNSQATLAFPEGRTGGGECLV